MVVIMVRDVRITLNGGHQTTSRSLMVAIMERRISLTEAIIVRDKKISFMKAIIIGIRQEDLANVGHHGKEQREGTLSWWPSFMRQTNYPSRRLCVYKRRIMVMDSRIFKDANFENGTAQTGETV
jgi:hypothetical protein